MIFSPMKDLYSFFIPYIEENLWAQFFVFFILMKRLTEQWSNSHKNIYGCTSFKIGRQKDRANWQTWYEMKITWKKKLFTISLIQWLLFWLEKDFFLLKKKVPTFLVGSPMQKLNVHLFITSGVNDVIT